MTPDFTPDLALVSRQAMRMGRQSSAELTGSEMTHILLIEDDDAVRESTKFVLETFGFSVSTAANCKKALLAYAQHKPDLVITDIVMPEMSGLEIVLRLRQLDPATPIVAVSGSWHRGPLVLLGDAEVLSKPFKDDELISAVGRCLQKIPTDVRAPRRAAI